jgi:hypothetical protein
MNPFKNIAGLNPRRSAFDNSYYKSFDCNLGQLIPVFGDLFLPGDSVKISVEALVRANPLIAPIMHRIDMKVDYFFVPLRIMWPKPEYTDMDGNPLPYSKDTSSWEEFITGGVSGKLTPAQPKWVPTDTSLYSLWDYFGFPLGIPVPVNPWLKRGYNMIYNEFFRPPDFANPIDLDRDGKAIIARWEKDYFTSALPYLQRGTAPSVSLTGSTSAKFLGPTETNFSTNPTGFGMYMGMDSVSGSDPVLKQYLAYGGNDFVKWLNDNRIDFNDVGTFDVNDLRYVTAIQKNLERSMRAGSRLTEQIYAHWGVHNGDARLQRPEYIGGMRSPIIISEVLQTSQTNPNSPQGTMAGHGIGTANTRIGSYYCKEHGVIIGIMRLMPKPVYQQGVNRQWLYETRFDYPTPELVNLGEQEIYNMELFATRDDSFNKGVFGYIGRYDEHRVKQNMICGRLRTGAPQSIGYWHLARWFSGDPNPPALNNEFLLVRDDQRYSAVQGTPSDPMPGWIVTFGNRVRRVAPLPVVGTPGLMDHN